MGRAVRAVVGVVLLVFGVIFALQGVDALHGSTMSGSSFWAVVGPLIALVGLGLLVSAAKMGR